MTRDVIVTHALSLASPTNIGRITACIVLWYHNTQPYAVEVKPSLTLCTSLWYVVVKLQNVVFLTQEIVTRLDRIQLLHMARDGATSPTINTLLY